MEKINRSKEILNSLQGSIDNLKSLISDSKNSLKDQDIYRSIILFSCSGIDALLKQLIEDMLEQVIQKNEGALVAFKDYTSKLMKSNDMNSNAKVLSMIFTSDNPPKKVMIEILKNDLVSHSLQSFEEISKVAKYFGISSNQLEIDKLKEVFEVRNQIVHEMDLDFKTRSLVKKERTYNKTMEYYANIIEVSNLFIKYVYDFNDKKILRKDQVERVQKIYE